MMLDFQGCGRTDGHLGRNIIDHSKGGNRKYYKMDDPYGSAAFHSYHIDVYGTDPGGTDTGPYLCDGYQYPP